MHQLDSLSQEVEEEEKPKKARFSKLFEGSAPLLKKTWPALLVVILVFLGSLYLISPLSKISTFNVSGNKNESSEQVALASGIQTSDSIFNILNNKEKIEATIEQKFPRISAVTINYHFPNRFEAIVKEHTNSVYVKRNNQTYLVLNNGYVITTPVDATKLEKLPVLQNFNDEEVKTFVNAYETLKPAIKSLMTNVTKTPTDATKDFIAIDMSDGNQVRVSLSQLADRLPYYPSVAKQVQAPQVVDMEAGIYTKPKAAYDAYLSQLSTSKSASISAQNAKKTEISGENTAQSTTTSSN
ncbi:Cell division protein DivIB [Lactococcus lactis]|nr:Cell division protein DivIB [Lactococcus lactis]